MRLCVILCHLRDHEISASFCVSDFKSWIFLNTWCLWKFYSHKCGTPAYLKRYTEHLHGSLYLERPEDFLRNKYWNHVAHLISPVNCKIHFTSGSVILYLLRKTHSVISWTLLIAVLGVLASNFFLFSSFSQVARLLSLKTAGPRRETGGACCNYSSRGTLNEIAFLEVAFTVQTVNL